MSACAFRLLFVPVLLLAAAVPESAPVETPRGATLAAELPAGRNGESGLPLPRFVALRAARVNLRTGPGVRYPIDWVYGRAGLPVEVVDEFETWRRVRDWQGGMGWVHQSMLTGERGAMVIGKQRLLRREPREDASGVALVEAGVVARLHRCQAAWCRIEVAGFEGWLKREEFYGAYPDEVVE